MKRLSNTNQNSNQLQNVPDPTNPQDAATKAYVDSQVSAIGDVDGPASSTDNAITRFDGTTGKLIQNSTANTIDDSGNMTTGQLLKIDATSGNPEFDFTESGTIRSKTYYDVTNNRLTFQNNENNNADALYFTDHLTTTGNITIGLSNLLTTGTVELGHATDTTIARSGAGDLTVEGNQIYRASGTDVSMADGGTGASLTDPNADRIMFWDDSAGAVTWLTAGTNLTITGTTIDATGGGGGVDTANSPAANEFARFTDGDTLEGRTAAETRADLDLEVGTDLQAYDADLTTIAGLTATTDNFMVAASSAWASRTPAQAKTSLALVKGDVGLGNVDNTSNATERAATATLTNKRVTPRVGTTTSSATPTINTDDVDMYGLTAQTANITSFTTNLSGTPTDGQKLWIYIVGTAARTIAWGASFEASTVPLPTTTVSTNRLDVGFVWNDATDVWRCVAAA